MHTRKQGDISEKLVLNYFLKLGYKFVAKNWYCRYGELDLVLVDCLQKSKKLVFVEVKSCVSFVENPAELVTYLKLIKLKKTMFEFIFKYRILNSWRLDVAAVSLQKYTDNIKIYSNIFAY